MVSSRLWGCGHGNREGHQDKTVLGSTKSWPNRIIGLIKETRVAAGEDSVEWVSKRGRHCQTSVSGSHITPQCDLKQRSMMQWHPDRQRSLCVCVWKNRELHGKRWTVTDNRVRWGVCRKSHKYSDMWSLTFSHYFFFLTLLLGSGWLPVVWWMFLSYPLRSLVAGGSLKAN